VTTDKFLRNESLEERIRAEQNPAWAYQNTLNQEEKVRNVLGLMKSTLSNIELKK